MLRCTSRGLSNNKRTSAMASMDEVLSLVMATPCHVTLSHLGLETEKCHAVVIRYTVIKLYTTCF